MTTEGEVKGWGTSYEGLLGEDTNLQKPTPLGVSRDYFIERIELVKSDIYRDRDGWPLVTINAYMTPRDEVDIKVEMEDDQEEEEEEEEEVGEQTEEKKIANKASNLVSSITGNKGAAGGAFGGLASGGLKAKE